MGTPVVSRVGKDMGWFSSNALFWLWSRHPCCDGFSQVAVEDYNGGESYRGCPCVGYGTELKEAQRGGIQ